MNILILYCIICYLFMFGFLLNDNKATIRVKVTLIIISPMVIPIMLGAIFYNINEKYA